MATLNRAAMEAMQDVPVHAATDVTGFGLLGHLRNVTMASGCTARISASAVPFMGAAKVYVREGVAPGGTHANARFLAEHVEYDAAVDVADRLLLCDAQTSGGLLIAVAPEHAEALLAELRERRTPCAAIVGALEEGLAPARMPRRRVTRVWMRAARTWWRGSKRVANWRGPRSSKSV